MSRTSKFWTISIAVIAVVFVVVFAGSTLINHLTADQKVTNANKVEILNKMLSDVTVHHAKPIKGNVDLTKADVAAELPPISKSPVTVENTTSNYAELFSSPEKAGSGANGWINDTANAFNKQGFTINGQTVSVKIRNVNSGQALDYIRTKKYVPDGFAPSNELWGQMVAASGIPIDKVSNSLVGNVAGIVLNKQKYNELKKEYGSITAKTIINAMTKSELTMGYTDPFQSSTGINFLVNVLKTFDGKNMLSRKSVDGFNQFQKSVPFTALTTLQMTDAAKSGQLDGFIMEYQTYHNDPYIRDQYVFTPFGIRHDNPLYALDKITSEKKQILQKFAQFAAQKQYQSLAYTDGFNRLPGYKSSYTAPDGNTLTDAQNLWKQNKNANNPVSAVFVADVSGSMNGIKISRLKESLITAQKYLGRNNSIGLLSYSDDVTVNLPIAKFDLDQQAKFAGAVRGLQASGGTATYDAALQAVKMLQNYDKSHPNNRPMIFILTDGYQNEGHSFDDVKSLLKIYRMPIYTIGYQANIDILKQVSGLNEAASINADSSDVIYQIKNLFNSQM
ncbi:VWA domain-containing protein [Sporolactobacillus laevolacticus]|uniref:VWA domain-containing protein n=1 Tax=Sporolactobacillus laevolacticus TaxID=33018 RepID=UPI0025B37B7C|nr:VWA domain-containing protein [Sporolactobacillus laevolacticus]MDN3954455.1 VWA domain-containing protein [Sporolactobacillus laevolacticus]